MDPDKAVNAGEDSGRIMIESVRPSEYDLAQLLAAITTKNLHGEINFGASDSKETL